MGGMLEVAIMGVSSILVIVGLRGCDQQANKTRVQVAVTSRAEALSLLRKLGGRLAPSSAEAWLRGPGAAIRGD